MAIHCGRLDAAQATVTLTIRSSLIFMKFRLCRRTHWRQSRIRQLVAVDIVAKVEHVQLGRLCRKSVILSPICGTSFRLCRQCDGHTDRQTHG